jgi:uncharacterized protein (TIGR03435 family)
MPQKSKEGSRPAMREQKHPKWHWHRLLHGVAAFGLAFSSLLAPRVAAQAITPQPPVASDRKIPVFDVISIKPNKSGSGRTNIDWGDGHFIASNVSLKAMILNAYDLKDSQLFGLPKWDDATRFDIQAKVIDPDLKAINALTDDQSRAMVQPILTDRFQLKFHHETKVLPVYELVVMKDGPKLKESKISGDQKADNGMSAGSMSTRNSSTASTGVMTTTVTSVAVPISSLTALLSSQLQRVVVDKTGLTGKYDLELAWSATIAPVPRLIPGRFPSIPLSRNSLASSFNPQNLRSRLS